MLDEMTELLGFSTVLYATAAVTYLGAAAVSLSAWVLLLRRWRQVRWSRFVLAVLLATTLATLVMSWCLEGLSQGDPIGIAIISYAGGGLAGLPVVLLAPWLVGEPKRRRLRAHGSKRPSAGQYVRKALLILMALPGVYLSSTTGAKHEIGEATPVVLLVMALAGLVGLSESLFFSQQDTTRNRRITSMLLSVGVIAGTATLVILIWILVDGSSYLHHSNRNVIRWSVYLLAAALPIALELRQLFKLGAARAGSILERP